MLIKSKLFIRPCLSDWLNRHEQEVLNKIQRISFLDKMTDSFLSRLVQDSIVSPPALNFKRMTRQLRTEQFDGSEFPLDLGFSVYRGKKYPRQVARISVPFSGDAQLMSYSPSHNTHTPSVPQGQVSGSALQFDIVLWGRQDDDQRVSEQLEENIRLLTQYVENSARDVKSFNETLPEKVGAAFERKLKELTRQHSIFDSLGIEEEAVPEISTPPAKPKRRLPRAAYIIQHVEHQYVQQLNQTNNNTGDVNNAIQSN